jgi:hypothetical protein
VSRSFTNGQRSFTDEQQIKRDQPRSGGVQKIKERFLPGTLEAIARKAKRSNTMKIVSAIALLAGMAAAIPAFAQTPDPATNAVAGGTGGAATGAIIGCIVTIPVGCAPGAAVGAAVGGGVGATAGVASTPAYAPPPVYTAPAPPPPPGYYH